MDKGDPLTVTMNDVGIAYLAAVSLFAAGLALYDKRAAQKGSWRIRERTLLIVSALGGSAAMLTAMLIARHKTKRLKFMLGIPVTIALQITAIALAWRMIGGGL